MGHDDPDERRYEDELLRAVVAAVDATACRAPLAMARPSPAQVRARVDARRRRQWWTVGLTSGAVAAVVVAVVLVLGLIRPGGDIDRPADGPTAPVTPPAGGPPSPLPVTPGGVPAREQLRALAGLAAADRDGCGTGPYTFVHLEAWSVDTTAPGGTGAAQTFRVERRWWKADLSGRQTVTSAGGGPETVDYPAGRLSVVVPEPSGDHRLLAIQLDEHQPFGNGPEAALRAVVDLYRFHCLDGPRRAAALRVLADVDAVRWHGPVVDRGGRDGIAVTVEGRGDGGAGDATRDVAVFDPATGGLLSYERVELSAGARAPAVVDHLLILDSGHTARVGQAPPG